MAWQARKRELREANFREYVHLAKKYAEENGNHCRPTQRMPKVPVLFFSSNAVVEVSCIVHLLNAMVGYRPRRRQAQPGEVGAQPAEKEIEAQR